MDDDKDFQIKKLFFLSQAIFKAMEEILPEDVLQNVSKRSLELLIEDPLNDIDPYE